MYFNFLPRDVRYWGRSLDYYDGQIWCLGFWFFHFYWWDKEPPRLIRRFIERSDAS